VAEGRIALAPAVLRQMEKPAPLQ